MNWLKDFKYLGRCKICGAEMWEEVLTGKIFSDHISSDHVCSYNSFL